MPKNEFTYEYNGKSYPVIVNYKRMRSIRYTFKDGVFRVNAPWLFASKATIIKGLDKYAEKLIKSDKKSLAVGDDYIYLLGTKIPFSSSGEIRFTNGEVINYKDKADFDKKIKKWFLKFMIARNTYYETIMGITKPYKVHVKKMSSRYGSNSSYTRSVSYALILMHYDKDVIDSVIVHELAHDKVRDHSSKFYDVVYKYCPNYKELHKRLRKGEFHD